VIKLKKYAKWFEENKLEILGKVQEIINVGAPALGCDVEQLIIENDKRMNAASWVLYYYILIEANIKNHKEYSKPSNYDEETLLQIEEIFQFNKQQFELALENLNNLKIS
jgi:hypothetical protein